MNVSLFVQFILTFIIELAIFYLFLRKKFKFFEIAGFVFLINLFSWPLAQLFYGIKNAFFLVELAIVIAESILIMLLFKIKYWKSLLISLAANFVSALIGSLL